MNVAAFLNVHFDLIQDVHRPYKKPNEDPFYIANNSKHSLTVIKQIHKAPSKRISDILWSKDIYNQNINYYEDALKHCGYDNISLPYSPAQEQRHDKIENE